MAKVKTEHYVNNTEFNLAMKSFIVSVDSSYYDTFGKPVTWKADEWLPCSSSNHWVTIVGSEAIKKQTEEYYKKIVAKYSHKGDVDGNSVNNVPLSRDQKLLELSSSERNKAIKEILYKKWFESEYFDRVKSQRSLKWKNKPRITRYIGSCFLKIATHLSYKSNFVNYMYREDMISDGIENCVQYIHNFNSEKSDNPFAYFTQISYYAFLRRIQREKRQLDIKTKIIEKSGFESLMTSDANLTNEYRNDYNAIKENIITKLNS